MVGVSTVRGDCGKIREGKEGMRETPLEGCASLKLMLPNELRVRMGADSRVSVRKNARWKVVEQRMRSTGKVSVFRTLMGNDVTRHVAEYFDARTWFKISFSAISSYSEHSEAQRGRVCSTI